MKEQIALFKSGLYSFLKRKLKTGLKSLHYTFWQKQKRLNSDSLSSLFSKRAKRGICSFKNSERSIRYFLSKNEQFTRKTKEQILKFPTLSWAVSWPPYCWPAGSLLQAIITAAIHLPYATIQYTYTWFEKY